MTPQEKIIWTENATPREQLTMLKLMNVFGKKFHATQEEIAEKVGVSVFTFIDVLRGLKDLGWVETKRIYAKGTKRGVKYCEYKLKV